MEIDTTCDDSIQEDPTQDNAQTRLGINDEDFEDAEGEENNPCGRTARGRGRGRSKTANEVSETTRERRGRGAAGATRNRGRRKRQAPIEDYMGDLPSPEEENVNELGRRPFRVETRGRGKKRQRANSHCLGDGYVRGTASGVKSVRRVSSAEMSGAGQSIDKIEEFDHPPGGGKRGKCKKRVLASDENTKTSFPLQEDGDGDVQDTIHVQSRETRRTSKRLTTAEEPPDLLLSGNEKNAEVEEEQDNDDDENDDIPLSVGTKRNGEIKQTALSEEIPEDSSYLNEDGEDNSRVLSSTIQRESKKRQATHADETGDSLGSFPYADDVETEDWNESSETSKSIIEKDDDVGVVSESEDKAIEEKEDAKKLSRRGKPWNRGRQKKSPAIVRLPPEATTDLPDSLKDELQHAFQIYMALQSVPKIGPFLERPSANMFGMTTYYSVVTTPIWLNEVKRKLMCHGYECMSEFVSDIRLMLENCYKFWGPGHKFSRTAFQIETKLEQKIESLPMALRKKCRIASFDGDGNSDFIDMCLDDFKGFSDESSDNSKQKCKSSTSKVLRRLTESKNSKSVDGLNLKIDEKKEEVILSWERTHLVTTEVKNEISSMWQLAAIGLFFKITHDSLNIKGGLTQFELERMLLIPKESTTLATLMTSMLSSSTIRSRLDATIPIMSYQVWNKKLKKKVEDWFSIFHHKNANVTEVFTSCGVEPCFWQSMTSLNPYENKEFCEMTFIQRCSIFKALCDNLCHTTKSIQELFFNVNSNKLLEDFKESQLGQIDNYTYFYLPFWPDIRVYRTRTISNKQWNCVKDISVVTSTLLHNAVSSDCKDEHIDELFDEFTLVAETHADVQALMEQVKEVSLDMTSKVRKFNQKVKKQSSLPFLPVLLQIYDQWNGYSDRVAPADLESVRHWEIGEDSDKGYFDVEDPEVLGKRQRRPNMSASNLTSSEEEEDIFDGLEDDDGSDWECPSEKKKTPKRAAKCIDNSVTNTEEQKKKKGCKTPRVKKSNVAKKKKMTNDVDSCSLVIKTVQSLKNDSNSPSELSVGKTLEDVTVKVENIDVVIKQEVIKEEVKLEIKREIKKEKIGGNDVISDVISLSSNDEDDDDDDVVITTPIKQQLPPTPVKSPPASSIRQPVQSPIRNTSPIIRSPALTSPRPATPGTPQAAQLSPRMRFTSPRMASPRQASPRMVSPRQASPLRPGGFSSPIHSGGFPSPLQTGGLVPSPRLRASPRGYIPPVQSRPQAQSQISRTLFNNSARPPQPNSKSITAKLVFGKRDDGSYGYMARLPDGGVIIMSPAQVEDIRKKNGTIPPVINIPLEKN